MGARVSFSESGATDPISTPEASGIRYTPPESESLDAILHHIARSDAVLHWPRAVQEPGGKILHLGVLDSRKAFDSALARPVPSLGRGRGCY